MDTTAAINELASIASTWAAAPTSLEQVVAVTANPAEPSDVPANPAEDDEDADTSLVQMEFMAEQLELQRRQLHENRELEKRQRATMAVLREKGMRLGFEQLLIEKRVCPGAGPRTTATQQAQEHHVQVREQLRQQTVQQQTVQQQTVASVAVHKPTEEPSNASSWLPSHGTIASDDLSLLHVGDSSVSELTDALKKRERQKQECIDYYTAYELDCVAIKEELDFRQQRRSTSAASSSTPATASTSSASRNRESDDFDDARQPQKRQRGQRGGKHLQYYNEKYCKDGWAWQQHDWDERWS
jgi:hypothetical protein